jgi:hypothetical protein
MNFICVKCGYEVDYGGDSNDILECGMCKGMMFIKNNKSLGLKCKNCGQVFTYYDAEAACMMKIREYHYKLGLIRKSRRKDNEKQDELVLRDADVHCCEKPHLEYCYWK